MTFGDPSRDILRQLFERERAASKLEKLGNVWIGSDFGLEKKVTVAPQETLRDINVILNKRNLPPLDIDRGVMGSLAWSMRSFVAQIGGEAMFFRNSVTDQMLKDINAGKDVLVPVNMENLGQRAIELGGDIMRFYWVNDNKRLRGNELRDVIKSGEFAIEGDEGKDKDWYLGSYFEEHKKSFIQNKNQEEALCATVRLKPGRFYIPYSPDLVRKDNNKKTRDDLTSYLQPVPDGMKLNFEIRETPRIKLGPNIVGVINTGAEKGQRHILSPLIDPGSDWPIRTETQHGLEHVDIFLYRK